MKNNTGVMVVAEAAQGYEGDHFLARLLVRVAAAARADMIKFQLVYADELATHDYPYYNLFKKLEMPITSWRSISQEASQRHLGLVFDVFGLESLRVAVELGASAVKVHASDFFNDVLVSAALEKAPHVFFSAGGIRIDEIAEFLERYGRRGIEKFTMLCGFQAEPTPLADNNLVRFVKIRERFPKLKLGFMDHSDGSSDEALWLGILALPYGVTAVEKHITLDRSIELEDYVSALAPADFALYVERIRKAETAMGADCLDLSEAEQAYRQRAVKVLVSARPIESGSTIMADDIAYLRIPTREGKAVFEKAGDVLGHRVLRHIDKGKPILKDDVGK